MREGGERKVCAKWGALAITLLLASAAAAAAQQRGLFNQGAGGGVDHRCADPAVASKDRGGSRGSSRDQQGQAFGATPAAGAAPELKGVDRERRR